MVVDGRLLEKIALPRKSNVEQFVVQTDESGDGYVAVVEVVKKRQPKK